MSTISEMKKTAIPFVDGVYTGGIHVSLMIDSRTSATFIRVSGERISLECFQGDYAKSLKEIFGTDVITEREELKDLSAIFANKTGMSNYGGRNAEDAQKILNRIDRDASRPYQGDVFTGFAIVNN